MRRTTLRVAGVVVVTLVLVLLVVRPRSPFRHKLVLKAYFTDAEGLRAGAPVRLAGVDVGTVRSVRARPEMKDAPAEVIMTLDPPYDLKVPADALASLQTAGVLGETYVDIDVKTASGPPAGPNTVLKVIPAEHITAPQFLEMLNKTLSKRSCDCGNQEDKPAAPAVRKKSQPHASR